MIQVGAPFRVKSYLRFRIEALSENQESWASKLQVDLEDRAWIDSPLPSISLDHTGFASTFSPFPSHLAWLYLLPKLFLYVLSTFSPDAIAIVKTAFSFWSLFPPISTAPPGSMLTKQYPQYFRLKVTERSVLCKVVSFCSTCANQWAVHSTAILKHIEAICCLKTLQKCTASWKAREVQVVSRFWKVEALKPVSWSGVCCAQCFSRLESRCEVWCPLLQEFKLSCQLSLPFQSCQVCLAYLQTRFGLGRLQVGASVPKLWVQVMWPFPRFAFWRSITFSSRS